MFPPWHELFDSIHGSGRLRYAMLFFKEGADCGGLRMKALPGDWVDSVLVFRASSNLTNLTLLLALTKAGTMTAEGR